MNYKLESNFIYCKIDNLKVLIIKSNNFYKVKIINVNIWCYVINDVGFKGLENFVFDFFMKLLVIVLCNLGVIWFLSYWLYFYRGWFLKFNFLIYDIWLNLVIGSFFFENLREMRVNVINFLMLIIILLKKVYFR